MAIRYLLDIRGCATFFFCWHRRSVIFAVLGVMTLSQLMFYHVNLGSKIYVKTTLRGTAVRISDRRIYATVTSKHLGHPLMDWDSNADTLAGTKFTSRVESPIAINVDRKPQVATDGTPAEKPDLRHRKSRRRKISATVGSADFRSDAGTRIGNRSNVVKANSRREMAAKRYSKKWARQRYIETRGRQHVGEKTRTGAVNVRPVYGQNARGVFISKNDELNGEKLYRFGNNRLLIQDMDIEEQRRRYLKRTLYDNRYKHHVPRRKMPCIRCATKQEVNKTQLLLEHKQALSKVDKRLVRNDTCNNCFRLDFDWLIPARNVCGGGADIDLVFLITTTHNASEARHVLRRTWLSHVKNNTKLRYVFMLGKAATSEQMEQVYRESFVYGDIVMSDFVDSYKNLTYKTMTGLKWAISVCQQARFIMKTDHDMFINVPTLLKLLNRTQLLFNNSVVGSCWTGTPHRDPSSKYYTSLESFPHFYFPPICSGTGYVLSMRTARKIYAVSPDIPFFHLEDVYIGLCLRRVNGTTRSYAGFLKRARPSSYGCLSARSDVISVHTSSSSDVGKIWGSDCRPRNSTNRWVNRAARERYNRKYWKL